MSPYHLREVLPFICKVFCCRNLHLNAVAGYLWYTKKFCTKLATFVGKLGLVSSVCRSKVSMLLFRGRLYSEKEEEKKVRNKEGEKVPPRQKTTILFKVHFTSDTNYINFYLDLWTTTDTLEWQTELTSPSLLRKIANLVQNFL